MPDYFLDILRDRYDVLLVANGQPLAPKLFHRLRERVDHLVALDGGVNALQRYGAVPDLVTGDMDSASATAVGWAKARGARVQLLNSQESPDLAKGLELCRSRGWKRFLVVGYTGARTDHTLGALTFAFRFSGIDLALVTDTTVTFPLRGRTVRPLAIPVRHTISWFGFPEAGPCSLTGVRWPFHNRLLKAGGFHSLSNEAVSDNVRLSQQAGRSLFVVSILPQVRVSSAIAATHTK